MIRNIPYLLVMLFMIMLAIPSCQKTREAEEQHRCEEHGSHGKESILNEKEHAGAGQHEEGEHEEHDHGIPEDHEEVRLTKKAIDLTGLKVSEVEEKRIARTIELPGEIGFNEDRLAHITPRYAGIVKEIRKHIGAYVKEGDVLAIIESNESLAAYSLRAPISGWIVEKHATPGEFSGEDADLFVVANLATVWVNCEAYAKDADIIKPGQPILIKAVGSDRQIQAALSYVAPVFNENTRSMIARAVISNTDGFWRPGTFITGEIAIDSDTSVPAVLKDAVQVLHDQSVVFIPVEEDAFKPVAVKTGLSDDTFVEIVSGLKPGEWYVSKGAFELKSEIVTSTLGSHAGHGH